MIRKARPEDKYRIAELIYIIWNDMELRMVKELPKEKVIRAMERSIVDVQYRDYYEHVYVYEVDGEVAGCLVSYPADRELEFERNWEKLDLPDDIKSYGTPLPVKEARDGEIYIESVATFSEYRGQGIASKLFKHVLETDTNATWGLICEKDNYGAQRLYEKLGFKVDGETELYGHKYNRMVYRGE